MCVWTYPIFDRSLVTNPCSRSRARLWTDRENEMMRNMGRRGAKYNNQSIEKYHMVVM